MKRLSWIAVWLLLVAPAVVMMGCQTIKGLGQDLQDASDNVEEAMQDD